MGLQPINPSSHGRPVTTPTQEGRKTPPAALTPPPVRQQGAMPPPNTPVANRSTSTSDLNAAQFSQLNISTVTDTDPQNSNLLKSPSAPDNQADPQEQNSLDSVSVNLFGSGAFDDDEATTTGNELSYETVIEFITHP